MHTETRLAMGLGSRRKAFRTYPKDQVWAGSLENIWERRGGLNDKATNLSERFATSIVASIRVNLLALSQWLHSRAAGARPATIIKGEEDHTTLPTKERQLAFAANTVRKTKRTQWSQIDEELLFICDRGYF